MIYCAVLNPALDIIYRLSEWQPGSTYTDIPSSLTPAGKGINVAKVVKTLGEEVSVIGLMPKLDLKRFSYYLENQKINSYLMPVEGNVRINTTLKEQSSGFVTHISSTNYRLSPRIQDEFQKFAEDYMQAHDTWVLSGSIPDGFDNDAYFKLIECCNQKKITAILDSRGLAFSMGVRAKPEIVKPNLTELENYFGEHIEGVHHIALKGKRLLDIGINYVIISLGSDGMIAIHDNDCLLCTPPQVEVIDTIGCGDALVAGLLVARIRNFSFMEACRLGIACGTSNAMHLGPGKVDNDEIWRIMEDVCIKAV